jgi:tRNA U34 2-thiouridine synthase MnmA/TrmU
VKEYWNNVFEPFLDMYQTGVLTPNPDALCNRYIKFNCFKKYVKEHLGIELMATGHYANISLCNSAPSMMPNFHVSNNVMNSAIHSNPPVLTAGLDENKDQSYFLSLTPVSVLLINLVEIIV